MGKAVLRAITDPSGLAGLRADWNALLQRSASDTVFLTWEWMYTWWECFGEGRKLFVILAEDGGNLVGIAPFQITKAVFFGLMPLNHLEFIGTSGVITEYPDFIILEGREEELVPEFLEFIFRHPSAWDVINLASMRQDAPSLEPLREYCGERGLNCWEYGSRVSLFVDLPQTIEAYLGSIGSQTRRKLRRYRKKLESGRVVEAVETVDSSLVARDLSTVIRLHQKRWERKGGPGSFARSRARFLVFHEKTARHFFDNGWLYLLRLMVDGVPVAGLYNFLYRGTVSCHSIGFDPDWAEYSVGSVIQLMAIEDAIGKGAREIDFLRGSEDYKRSWARNERTSVDTAIFRDRRVALRVAAERRLRKAARRLLPASLAQRVYSGVINRL